MVSPLCLWSMTVFEFISTCMPRLLRTTQELLMGLWYATFSIRYLAVGTVIDNLITERRSCIAEASEGLYS